MPGLDSSMLCKAGMFAAEIVAVGVNSDGRREVLGMDIGPSKAETFWTAFLRKLASCGLIGTPDSHDGIKGGRIEGGAGRDLAALPGSLHEERARP